MANTQAFCTSAKVELLNAIHAFGTTVTRGATTADTFKMALFLASATINASTTTYSTTGELAASGNYTAGGKTLTFTAPSASGTAAVTTPNATVTWTALTSSGSFDCAEIYNSTQTNRAFSVHTFGAQSIVAGDFSLTMPVNAAGTALIQIT